MIDIGQTWNDTILCETCTCLAGGYVDCNPTTCSDCPKGWATVYKSGLCCPICVADWINEKEEYIEIDEGDGPATMECEILEMDIMVSADDVSEGTLCCSLS